MKAQIHETKAAEKGLMKAPPQVIRSYEIWARMVEEHGIAILREFRGYNDEKLSGEWQGHRSSRLNKQWRVIYKVDPNKNIQIITVVRVTAHDYRRK